MGISRRKKLLKDLVNDGSMDSPHPETGNDACDEDWEDGTISGFNHEDHHPHMHETDVCIEFNDSPSSGQGRKNRRPTTEEKALAELVRKTHLLCLIARGRLVDSVCDDPLIQASLFSMLPSGLVKKEGVLKWTVNGLVPLVNWFRYNFRVKSSNLKEGNFKANVMLALGNCEGTAEEVAALSVALFRALNLSTRFVSILDVTSLKPDADDSWRSDENLPKMDTKISSSSSLKIIPSSNNDSTSSPGLTSSRKLNRTITESAKICKNKQQDSQSMISRSKIEAIETADVNDQGKCTIIPQKNVKRKGDVEFDLQLEMALSATALKSSGHNVNSNNNDICSSSSGSPFKRLKKSERAELSDSAQMDTGAVWSRKKGPPLYWAEVFCGGESSSGKWVHVDAANGIVNREQEVESASAASRRPLKYVLAFAGLGAKDVTRRYCTHWYKIASQRVDTGWWAKVLAPLKQLESATTEAELSEMQGENTEDMELEIRGLTEPLPGNQQAYRKHHLYALEKFLTKYEALYPKGPVLGYCSGHPVYPRACVQMLHTRQRWLREGLQVKVNETPAKVVKSSQKLGKRQDYEGDEVGKGDERPLIELYGKWQVEPLYLPPAVDGIVPKNERGQVEVWSEKCLPPGTVHLRLPRLFPVAKRLGVDFAPAMIGFEFRSGRSFPVFEGIVVCSEFKDAILEAYAEEEEKREAEEKKRSEAQALSRWYQLLCSIMTRQRLNSTYLDPPKAKYPSKEQINPDKKPGKVSLEPAGQDPPPHQKEHEHIFPIEDQSFDDESFIRTKRCPCGFSIQMEEL